MSLSITSIRTAAKARSFFGKTACALVAMTLGTAPALAQDQGSMTVGNTTVTVGAGAAILTLPDVEFLALTGGPSAPTRFDDSFAKLQTSDDFGDEIGFNVNGSIEFPVSGRTGGSTMIGVSGFYSHIEDDDTLTCTGTANVDCKITNIVDDPNRFDSFFTLGIAGSSLIVTSDREVDHWGVSVEARRRLTPGVMGVTRAPNPRSVSLGLDWRSLDQDLSVNAVIEGNDSRVVNYAEQLDTNYYGVYASWGGDYSPFLFRGLWNRLGLESSFRLRGGVYHAETDYNGNYLFTSPIHPNYSSRLSLSNDEIAFIGGLSLETRKRISPRATLSLKSEYEYYSYVPDMRYNDNDVDGVFVRSGPNVGTSIGGNDAFSARTTLRLTIKLGPDSVFEEPLK